MLLEVQSLQVYYGELPALDGVTLHVEAGELVGLVGANGAGKTTLLRTISGVIPARAGTIRFNGQDLKNVPAHQLPELGIVHVPEGRRLFPHQTVQDNLMLGAYHKRARAEMKKNLARIYQLLPRLEERQKQLAGSLSGGEQQMAALGRALMAMPTLLTLDEPSLGLAPIIVQDIFNLIREVRQEGVTVLLVEQNVRRALSVCDRGYVMQGGRIVMEDTGAALLERPDLKARLLGLSPVAEAAV